MPPKQRPYIIDANTFMEAARGYYSFDFAKPFWNKLPAYGDEGKIISLDKVFDEIDKGNDELKKWANNQFKKHFAPSQTSEILMAYADLVNWVDSQSHYSQTAKDKFMDDENADAWIIAYAKAHNCILITDEKPNPASQKRVLIPDVCDAFRVDYTDIFAMLKALRFSFNS